MRRYSREVFFFCSGYLTGSHSPNTSISFAWISTAWPLPTDSIRSPVTLMLAPVVIFAMSASSKLAMSATTCILFTVEPSLRAMNLICLLPLLVLTQPFARTSCPGVALRRSFTLLLVTIFLRHLIQSHKDSIKFTVVKDLFEYSDNSVTEYVEPTLQDQSLRDSVNNHKREGLTCRPIPL